jgi:alpha-galactosidase
VTAGGSVRSDRLVISFDSSPVVNLERYGEYLQNFAPTVNKPFSPTGKGAVNKSASSRVPAGWCSWYYYYQHISEDSILLNLNAAARELKEAGLRYIQIDDGYQIAAGDWDANAKFPHGHRWLVDRIHEKGLLAGLWVAPFAIAESSSIYAEHRDWLLKDAGDTLKQFFAKDWWGGRIFSLDPTRHDVQLWLENLFYKITNTWDYDYVKIDFLYFPGEGGKYSHAVSPPQAYQMGLQAIRRGVGSDRFILGSGAPIGPSIGFVDGMRIGTDIYAGWGGITAGASAAANRWFYHRSVWYNDPDCLVVREPLTLDQARIWAAVVALSGQMNMLSDKLTGLSADRLDLLRMTLPSYGQPARPVDLFTPPRTEALTVDSPGGASAMRFPDSWKFTRTRQSNLPSIWNLAVSKDFEKWNVVGVFNWSGDPGHVTVDLADLGLAPKKKYLVYERWSDRYLGEFKGSVELALKATSSQILSVHENPDRPVVLSTSRHLTEGAVDLADEKWDDKLRTLAVTSDNLIPGTYSAAIYIPAGFEFKDVISPMKCTAGRVSNNILKLDFTGIRRHSFAWKVRFN